MSSKNVAIGSATMVFLALLSIAWNQAHQEYDQVGLSAVGWFVFVFLGVIVFGFSLTKFRSEGLAARIYNVEQNVYGLRQDLDALTVRVGQTELGIIDIETLIRRDNWRLTDSNDGVYLCEPAGYEQGQPKYLAHPAEVDLGTYISLMKSQPQGDVQGIFYLTEGGL